MQNRKKAMAFALLAAALYAMNVPVSKLLLEQVQPTMMAAFLYLGAGIGMALYAAAGRLAGKRVISEPLTKKELPDTLAMIVLDIAAPILLMIGITHTSPASASLLNNFEIVATSLIAFVVFRERISRRLWAAIALVVAASILLTLEEGALQFGWGALPVLGACMCWGMENNCTRRLSGKSSVQIVIVKGCCSGLGSLLVALIAGERLPGLLWVLCAMALGLVAYGMSINYYVKAQKDLGAAKTSAFYSVAPFLGVAFSMLLGDRPAPLFWAALVIMAAAAALMAADTLAE